MLSNINNHGVSMNYKTTTIIAGTMLTITSITLPALATVSNTNDQHLMGRQHEIRLSEKMHSKIFGNHKDKVIKISQHGGRICFTPNQCFQDPPPPPPPIS